MNYSVKNSRQLDQPGEETAQQLPAQGDPDTSSNSAEVPAESPQQAAMLHIDDDITQDKSSVAAGASPDSVLKAILDFSGSSTRTKKSA